MKKYKIGNRIITCDSPVKAVKIAKMLDSVKDSAINVKKVHNASEKYVVLEEDRPDGKEFYWVVGKNKYHGEKQYMGGGTLEFHLDEAIRLAKDYTIMEQLNAKYGEKEGYKRWMAGYTDSVKDEEIVRTPRGTFKLSNKPYRQLKEEGWGFWFDYADLYYDGKGPWYKIMHDPRTQTAVATIYKSISDSVKDAFDISKGAYFKEKNRSDEDAWKIKVIEVKNGRVYFQTMRNGNSGGIDDKPIDIFRRILEGRYKQVSSWYDSVKDQMSVIVTNREDAEQELRDRKIQYDTIKLAAGTNDLHYFNGDKKVAIYSKVREKLYLMDSIKDYSSSYYTVNNGVVRVFIDKKLVGTFSSKEAAEDAGYDLDGLITELRR